MEDKRHSLLPDGTYVMIWFSLVVLTGLTVTVTTLRLGEFAVYTAIFIALTKASLVVVFFMNLKKEPLVFKVMLAVALVTLAVIMVFTFFDISYR